MKKRHRFKDLTGQQFGRLMVIKKVGISKNRNYLWECLCNCGNKKNIVSSSLVSGITKSCGCFNIEMIKKRMISHGFCVGKKQNRFYKIWIHILERCNKKSSNRYKNYGERGIKCLWKSFEKFRDDMYESYLEHVKKFGEKQTQIDRIDNDGNYYKENCRWVTLKEQARNKTNTKKIIYNKKSFYLSELSEKTGIKESTLRNRLFRDKWSIEKALTTPVLTSHKKGV